MLVLREYEDKGRGRGKDILRNDIRVIHITDIRIQNHHPLDEARVLLRIQPREWTPDARAHEQELQLPILDIGG